MNKYWLIDMLTNAVLGAIAFPVVGRMMNANNSTTALIACGALVGALLAFSLRCLGGRLVAPM